MDVLGYLKFLAALIFVLALIAGLAYGVRRYGLGGIVTTPGRHQASPGCGRNPGH